MGRPPTRPNESAIRVAIIGAGISGIAQAVRLQEELGRNVELTIYERAGEVGGVWRDSTWPGTAVDVPIHLYCLYSHLNPEFSSKWAGRDEVLAYWKKIADGAGLNDKIVYRKEFVSSYWNSAKQKHEIRLRDTQTGSILDTTATVLIAATGALNKPIIPDVPGINDFQGLQWHSSRWNNDVSLAGKKIAIVGNGSSGIQVVPHIVDEPGLQLVQFIRSPGYFRPKVNFKYPEFQKFVFRWIPGYLRLYRWKLFAEYDRNILSRGTGTWSTELRDTMSKNIVKYMKERLPVRYHETLIPKYPLHCKRVAYDAGWLDALKRPNVELVADPITKVTQSGIVTANGTTYDFDIIVWATGFEVSETGVGLNHGVHDVDGKELRQTWKENQGAYGYLGVAAPKVPNYFIPLGPNAIANSWGYSLGHNTEFIARIVKGIHEKGLSSIVVKDSVMTSYNESLRERLAKVVFALSSCGSSWYKDPKTGRIVAPAPWNATELWTHTRKIRWADWEARRFVPGHKAVVVSLVNPSSWTPWAKLADILAARLQKWLERLMTYTETELHHEGRVKAAVDPANLFVDASKAKPL